MPWGLKRFQQTGDLHFITFTCYRRIQLLSTPQARDILEETLERVRSWYGFTIVGYVVMPEHVHLLVSEPERSSLAVALQMLKQITARKLRLPGSESPFWQRRYYDFNVYSERKVQEKLDSMHTNPVKRGLVRHPGEWRWSSFEHWTKGTRGAVELESPWTANRRERMGVTPRLTRREI